MSVPPSIRALVLTLASVADPHMNPSIAIMSRKMVNILIAYGVILATLGLVQHEIAPTPTKVILIAGIVGGALSLVWGVLALTGYKRRSGAFITLIAVAIVVLSQVVPAWSDSGTGTRGSLAGPLLLTFMMLLTVGMLMYILHGERPPEFYSKGTARWDNSVSRRNVDPSEGGRHHR